MTSNENKNVNNKNKKKSKILKNQKSLNANKNTSNSSFSNTNPEISSSSKENSLNQNKNFLLTAHEGGIFDNNCKCNSNKSKYIKKNHKKKDNKPKGNIFFISNKEVPLEEEENYNLEETNQKINFFRESEIQIEKVIGEGGNGSVHSAKYLNLNLAVKKVKKEEYNKEKHILLNIKHSYIPFFFGLFLTKDFANFCIERIEGIDLSELIIRLENIKTEENFKEIYLYKLVLAINLVSSIEYLHLNNIVHRDIKPSNIMISKYHKLKLLDFGISKVSADTYSTENPRSGTLSYMSPEFCPVLNEKGDLKVRLSSKTDIWALGLVLNELFSGEKPWSKYIKTGIEIFGILFDKKKFIVGESLPYEIKHLIENCTTYSQEERWDSTQIKFYLIEVFFNSFREYNQNHTIGLKFNDLILKNIYNNKLNEIVTEKTKQFAFCLKKFKEELFNKENSKFLFLNYLFNPYYNLFTIHKSILGEKIESNDSSNQPYTSASGSSSGSNSNEAQESIKKLNEKQAGKEKKVENSNTGLNQRARELLKNYFENPNFFTKNLYNHQSKIKIFTFLIHFYLRIQLHLQH